MKVGRAFIVGNPYPNLELTIADLIIHSSAFYGETKVTVIIAMGQEFPSRSGRDAGNRVRSRILCQPCDKRIICLLD